jgi:hypothetical protein
VEIFAKRRLPVIYCPWRNNGLGCVFVRDGQMLASYLDRAIEQAVYEIIEDEKVYWGEIPGPRCRLSAEDYWKALAGLQDGIPEKAWT